MTMTLILNTEDDPIVDAIEEILEICEDPENNYKHDAAAKLDSIRRIATRAIVIDERERYLFPAGSC